MLSLLIISASAVAPAWPSDFTMTLQWSGPGYMQGYSNIIKWDTESNLWSSSSERDYCGGGSDEVLLVELHHARSEGTLYRVEDYIRCYNSTVSASQLGPMVDFSTCTSVQNEDQDSTNVVWVCPAQTWGPWNGVSASYGFNMTTNATGFPLAVTCPLDANRECQVRHFVAGRPEDEPSVPKVCTQPRSPALAPLPAVNKATSAAAADVGCV
jgi:hypothetical protein